MKKILFGLLLFISLSLLTLYITDKTYLLKGVRITYLQGKTDVTIDDFKLQATRTIKAGSPTPWPLHEQYNQVELSEENLQMHKELGSIAFLIIKDGKLLTEQYFDEGAKGHLSGVWSVSKTYTSLLILKAIEDGLIDNIDDPVKKYIPEWNVEQEQTLTLRHLASMSAGLYWEERIHTPLALITKLNFYDDLEKFTIEDMYAIGEPGKIQHYNSGGTQTLGTVLKRVLKSKTISDYLSEKFWTPLGYEYDGLYILDSEQYGNEKAFGGIVTTARDVSKLGQLLLNNGAWNGQQILSESHVDLIKTIPYQNRTYAYGIWTGVYKGSRFYFQAGFKGQFCITFPEQNLVVTRLGHHSLIKDDIEDVPKEIYKYIEEALRVVEKSSTQSF